MDRFKPAHSQLAPKAKGVWNLVTGDACHDCRERRPSILATSDAAT
jgi:hypothetical protein